MIECEACQNWYHCDCIRECGECNSEFCEECYENHECSDYEEYVFESDDE